MNQMETVIMFYLGLGRLGFWLLFVSLVVVLYIYLSDKKIAEKIGDIGISIISLCLIGVVLYFVNGYAVQFKLDKSKALLEDAKIAWNKADTYRAIDLFQQSIDLDNADAMYGLGLLYIRENGDRKNKGIELLQKASSLGHLDAKEKLKKLDQ